MAETCIKVEAFNMGLTDLDFPLQARKLGQTIGELAVGATTAITLDLRGCVVLYSCSNEFLDVALRALLDSSPRPARLEVLTSLDYLDEALTAYELFRGCLALNKTTTSATVGDDLRAFCRANSLEIRVVVDPPSLSSSVSSAKEYIYR